MVVSFKGLASHCQAKTTFTFHFSIITLSNAFFYIRQREMKSESGFSLAMASQPFLLITKLFLSMILAKVSLFDTFPFGTEL